MKHYTENILEAPDTEYVCWCNKVSKAAIKKTIKNGAKNFVDVRNVTNACAGGNCKKNNPRGRCCSAELTLVIAHELGETSPLQPLAPAQQI